MSLLEPAPAPSPDGEPGLPVADADHAVRQVGSIALTVELVRRQVEGPSAALLGDARQALERVVQDLWGAGLAAARQGAADGRLASGEGRSDAVWPQLRRPTAGRGTSHALDELAAAERELRELWLGLVDHSATCSLAAADAARLVHRAAVGLEPHAIA